MRNVDVTTMKKWLRDVLECEIRVATIDSVISELDQSVDEVLTKYEVPTPEKPQQMYGCATFLIISSLFLFPLAFMARRDQPLFGGLWTFVEVVLVLGFIGAIAMIKDGGKEQVEFEEALVAHREEVKAEDERMAEIQEIVVPEIEQRISEYSDTLDQVVGVLDRLYATGYLSSEYQGLVPVATMLGYLESGRCTTVYGHGGIIDTYVHDSQFDILNGKLDTIIRRLDDIQHSQAELYRAVNELRHEQSELLSEIQDATDKLHFDNQGMLACEKYNAQTLNYIATISNYRALQSSY